MPNDEAKYVVLVDATEDPDPYGLMTRDTADRFMEQVRKNGDTCTLATLLAPGEYHGFAEPATTPAEREEAAIRAAVRVMYPGGGEVQAATVCDSTGRGWTYEVTFASGRRLEVQVTITEAPEGER